MRLVPPRTHPTPAAYLINVARGITKAARARQAISRAIPEEILKEAAALPLTLSRNYWPCVSARHGNEARARERRFAT